MTKLGETENCEVKQFHEAGNNETRPHSVRLMKCLLSITSFIIAAFVRARLSGLGQNKDLAGGNPIRGHETLTFDPTCDTSGSVVPQVSIERANTFPAAVSDAVLWPVSAGAAKTLVTFVFVTR
ncbi:hypothetical protein KUCAC02_016117 [Chaenocephalus aceratus]|uniref:Uncharacterized protein n=1 Tax=Chaenocephalus aceratus TaxID=36190 RepID=A0ACB9Y0W6_CHAAC|nr:hypothetical protein KUCAC02_016117 [Chaenocephalus aceratus]